MIAVKRLVLCLVCSLVLAASTAGAQSTAAPSKPGNPGPATTFGMAPRPAVWIGVTVRDVQPADVSGQTVQGGADVTSIRPGSPAASAGFQVSDIITEFDGEQVRSARALARLVEETPAGRSVNVTLLRSGHRQNVSVTPMAAPPFTRGPNGPLGRFNLDPDRLRQMEDRLRQMQERMQRLPAPFAPAQPRLGVTIQEMTPELADYFGAKEGVLIANVADGSAAAKAGLKVGDVIVSAAGQPVRSRADLLRALPAGGGSIVLGIVRNKQPRTITATLEGSTAPSGQTFRRDRPL